MKRARLGAVTQDGSSREGPIDRGLRGNGSTTILVENPQGQVGGIPQRS